MEFHYSGSLSSLFLFFLLLNFPNHFLRFIYNSKTIKAMRSISHERRGIYIQIKH